MKMRARFTAVGFLVAALLSGPAIARAQVLGDTAATFSVLGASTVTSSGATTVNGNLGVSPGTAITGSPTVTGETHSAGPVAAQAQDETAVTYGALDGLPCDRNLSGLTLGTSTGARNLRPGVYCFDAGAQLTGTLNLDSRGQPDGVWVFQVGDALTTAPNSQVLMGPDSNANNVFWQVTSSATIGNDSVFAGNLIALISITLNPNAVVNGRVFARTGAVTMDNNTVGPVAFAPSRPPVRVVGLGEIRVPRPNDNDPTAAGPGRATFDFDIERAVDSGPITGVFEYSNPVQRLEVKGRVSEMTVVSRNPGGSIKSLLFSGICSAPLPRCTFAVTVTENDPGTTDQLGITVSGALHEVRSSRPVVEPGSIVITEPLP